jgi:CheY-like chemotaxis protein
MTKFLIVKDSADKRRLMGQMLSNLGEVYECEIVKKRSQPLLNIGPDGS